jgi:hypothetical protein
VGLRARLSLDPLRRTESGGDRLPSAQVSHCLCDSPLSAISAIYFTGAETSLMRAVTGKWSDG